MHWFFLVQVIQAGGYMSRPRYSGPNPAVWFKEMRREHAIKFTFDPVNPYPIRDKVVAREAMPLFSIADPQPKLCDWRQVDALFVLPILLELSLVFLEKLRRGKRGFEQAGDIEEPWNFLLLELINNSHGGVVVFPECKDARERDESREENNRQRRPTEELGTGCLATGVSREA